MTVLLTRQEYFIVQGIAVRGQLELQYRHRKSKGTCRALLLRFLVVVIKPNIAWLVFISYKTNLFKILSSLAGLRIWHDYNSHQVFHQHLINIIDSDFAMYNGSMRKGKHGNSCVHSLSRYELIRWEHRIGPLNCSTDRGQVPAHE